MNSNFEFDPAFKLENKIIDLKLSSLFLHDNKNFPWVVLVPRSNDITELYQLSLKDKQLLLEEIDIVSRTLKGFYNGDKINIASFGNIVSQLHIHIIIRFKNDIAWPESVFGKESVPYDLKDKASVISKLNEIIKKVF